MKSFILILTLVASGLSLTACRIPFGITINTVRGSGVVKSETRDVSNFQRVSLAGIGELTITQGDSEGLTIAAEDNLLPLIETQVAGGTLEIRIKQGVNPAPTKTIQYSLKAKKLDGVELSGAGRILASTLQSDAFSINVSGAGDTQIDKLTAQRLDVRMSGAGNAQIAGDVPIQSASLSGIGSYRAGDLKSQSAKITISGAGNATVWVSQTLDVSISGAGSVDYYGSPQVTKQVSGVGSVKDLGTK